MSKKISFYFIKEKQGADEVETDLEESNNEAIERNQRRMELAKTLENEKQMPNYVGFFCINCNKIFLI